MEEDLNNVSSLVSKIAGDISAYLNRRLAEQGFSGIASSHGYILYLLAKNGKMKMGDLARRIHKDKSTATALIKKLEGAGYIKKERCLHDSRVTFILLTEKGSAYTQATADISQALIDTCYKGFSEKDKQTLFTLLCRMEANFNQ
ncbi:winged helix-turn-helix transcriptional regulator [Treponema sp. OMZ 840]|uniref:MarR family winged helix-turn-helix transcriptional regulator n=1 Tax=Treponema sp. OMZ 840 TaxID=244313 RepID=UPI003D92594D